jgi:tryptophanyl-tRNA synthetase
LGYGEAKQLCFERVNAELADARERYNALRSNPEQLEGILEAGRDKAKLVAREVLARVRSRVGLYK